MMSTSEQDSPRLQFAESPLHPTSLPSVDLSPQAGRGDSEFADAFDLRPNLAILACGSVAIGIVSLALLPWPLALASTVLGALMIAGADVDARTLLLPDIVTYGAAICGILAAAVIDPLDPWQAVAAAFARAVAAAFVLAAIRWSYGRLRAREGLGWGDVKLSAAIGAWLPIDAIPWCFGLAAGGALIAVMVARLRGETVDGAMRIPFGAFLCPALWLVFYASVLQA
jgi:leader peptidase (prepilin peptidase)/N-methyltransferase